MPIQQTSQVKNFSDFLFVDLYKFVTKHPVLCLFNDTKIYYGTKETKPYTVDNVDEIAYNTHDHYAKVNGFLCFILYKNITDDLYIDSQFQNDDITFGSDCLWNGQIIVPIGSLYGYDENNNFHNFTFPNCTLTTHIVNGV